MWALLLLIDTKVPVAPRIAQYQLHKCQRRRVGCPVCADGHRNYYYKPIKCPHAFESEKTVLHPELSSDSESEMPMKLIPGIDVINSLTGFSATCSCEYPRWCTLVSNRDYINDDIFEITSEEPSCCSCKPKKMIVRWVEITK